MIGLDYQGNDRSNNFTFSNCPATYTNSDDIHTHIDTDEEGGNSRFYPVARISCSRGSHFHQLARSCSCFPLRNEDPTDDRDDVDACLACCAHRKCSSTSARPSVPIALPPSSISSIPNPLLAADLQSTTIFHTINYNCITNSTVIVNSSFVAIRNV